jgi:hypothetical protein
VSEHVKHVPKHRQPAARRAPRQAVRTLVVLSSLAVAGTATAVAGGALSLDAVAPRNGASDAAALDVPSLAAADVDQPASEPAPASPSSAAASTSPSSASEPVLRERVDQGAELEAERGDVVSRSDRRGVADPLKQAALSLDAGGNALTRSEDASDEDPRSIARLLLGDATQFECLDSLWTKESGWRVDADNPSSSAYGIPQALPGSKMSTFGADWATNPVTQIRWGLDYIEDRYGSPCGAWSHSQAYNFY